MGHAYSILMAHTGALYSLRSFRRRLPLGVRAYKYTFPMPKRSNDFQRLVYLVRVNLAEGAKVTESKMMRDRLTKRFREVDVVVEGAVGGQDVVVSIECRDHQRVADVTWVDLMKAKHDRLDTNALILASRSGFTPEARDVADKFGIKVFTLDDIEGSDLSVLLAPDGELWIKSVTITGQKVTIAVPSAEDLAAETVVANPDNLVHLEDGTEVLQVQEIVDGILKSSRLRDYLLSEGLEEHKWFEFAWESPRAPDGKPFYLKKLEPSVLRPIDSIRVVGPCTVEIGRFGMRHGKIGNVTVAWGKIAIAGRDTMAVATVDGSGQAKLSINVAGASGAPSTP
jgi:hypothetical protein